MSDLGAESYVPGEGGGGAPEQLSEEAKQRFAAAAAAMQVIQREERKSKKRDSRVAKTIIRFLNDDRYTHLFVLISRLVARDCPSIFILVILSLIDDECRTVVQEYLQERSGEQRLQKIDSNIQLLKTGTLEPQAHARLVEWITRMQLVLSEDPKAILAKLMIDEDNIDGTVLQLATFVLQEFFQSDIGGRKTFPFQNLQGLTGSILQTVFEPFMSEYEAPSLQRIENADDES